MDRALAQMGDKSARSEGDFAQRVVIRKHRDDRVATTGRPDIGCELRALRDKWLGSGAGAIENAQLMTRFQQVGRHSDAHLPQADKADFHVSLHIRDRRCGPTGRSRSKRGLCSQARTSLDDYLSLCVKNCRRIQGY